ncbi:MAG: HdeD family acid-resistance protein [Verrucomicrobiota bacterium]
MTNDSSITSAATDLSKSRGWLIAGGILSIFVGFSAIGSPLIFSLVIAQFLGLFALISGVISLALAVFGKHKGHRVMEALSGLIRIAAGIALLNCLTSSVLVITLIFAIFLIIEGVFVSVTALSMRATPGWVWMLVSGVASLVLGIMVYKHWPSDSAAILGLFFGINLLFKGSSLLALGLSAPKASAP